MILALKDYSVKGSDKANSYLKAACKDKNEEIQKAAIEALGSLGPLADTSSIRYLESLAKKKDKGKSQEFAELAEKALQNLHYLANQETLQKLPVLLGQLSQQDKKIVETAIEELTKLGEVIIPDLTRALRDEERLGKASICIVLSRLKFTEEQKELLLAVAETAIYEEPEVKIQAIRTLSKQGSLAKDYLPYIVDGLLSDSPEVREVAAEALGDLGSLAQDALDSLIQCLKDSEPTVRMAVATALGKMREAASKAKEPLKEAIQQENDEKVKAKMENTLEKL